MSHAFWPRLVLAALACATVWFVTATPAPVSADARPALIPAAAHAPAALCYGGDCSGLNPDTMGCGADVQQGSYTTVNGAFIENRYSPTCNAEWAKTTNQAGAPRYAAASIRYGCMTYCYHHSVKSPAPIGNGEAVVTPMLGPDTLIDAMSCGKVATTGPIAIPVTSFCLIVN